MSRAPAFLALTLMASGLLGALGANAQVINYPNGFGGATSSPTGGTGPIWLENSAALSGPAIQLTSLGGMHQGNNAWYETPVNVQAFTTTFTWTVNCGGNVSTCANGMGFMIISTSNPSPAGFTYSGFSGNQFSYSQCTGNGLKKCPAINALLVKFDLFNETNLTYGASLTGFYSGATYPEPPNNPQYDMAPAGVDLTSGDLMRATLTYDGTKLIEVISDTVTGATYTNTYTANIPSLVGGNTAYVGFGAGTGDTSTVTQNLSSWTYTVESPGQAAVPTFSPAAGTYSGSQSVVLSTSSPGAVICYNTAGGPATNASASCTTGTLYTGPATVSSSETLYAVSGGTGYKDSPVVNASYVIQNAVATPTFSPSAGTYNSAQSVIISDATSNAIIYYTTNGSAPTSSSTKYTGPITVGTSEKLAAIAVSAGNTTSLVASAVYTITSPTSVLTPTFSPPAGSYTSVQQVAIADATPGATIYYTTNGSAPTTSSPPYTGPVTVGATQTLEAIAVVTGNIESAIASAAYVINLEPSVATPTFSPAGGTYASAQTVTLSDATSGATIYYTANGSTPTTSSIQYTSPIAVGATESLKAIALAAGDNASAVAFAAYNINLEAAVSTPAFSPPGGAYPSAQSVTISDATSGAMIYYTTNGTTPTKSSTTYTGPIAVGTTETLEAVAVASGDIESAVASAAYSITSSTPSVSTPIFYPPAGTYNSAQSVTISDATSGANIYYTTNGSTPTTSSTAYTSPITVGTTETLEAIAVTIGETNSAVAFATYTIPSIPKFMLASNLASLTIDSSSAGTVTLSVTPENGFDSAVSFACSGLPSVATCAFAPATVTPSGAAATTQLTISTSAQSSALQPGHRTFFPFASLAVTVFLFGWKPRRDRHHWLLVALACAGLGYVSGCGGSGGASGASSPTSTMPVPTSTTSTVTVTATSGNLQATTTIALTLN